MKYLVFISVFLIISCSKSVQKSDDEKKSIKQEVTFNSVEDIINSTQESIYIDIYSSESLEENTGFIIYEPNGDIDFGYGGEHVTFVLLKEIRQINQIDYYFSYMFTDGSTLDPPMFYKSTITFNEFLDALNSYKDGKSKYIELKTFHINIGNNLPDEVGSVKLPWEK